MFISPVEGRGKEKKRGERREAGSSLCDLNHAMNRWGRKNLKSICPRRALATLLPDPMREREKGKERGGREEEEDFSFPAVPI